MTAQEQQRQAVVGSRFLGRSRRCVRQIDRGSGRVVDVVVVMTTPKVGELMPLRPGHQAEFDIQVV
jgi:hypothetical protein